MYPRGNLDPLTDPSLIYRYYAAVVAAILTRKVEWLRNTSLAVALLFPTVAAIHAIVLAVTHVDGQFSQKAEETMSLLTQP